MEVHLGRILTKAETVDHIDRNKRTLRGACVKNNNLVENLQILSWDDHKQADAIRVKPLTLNCALTDCNKEFTIPANKMHEYARSRRAGKSGPYCSRRCAGIDSHNKNRKTIIVEREYYQLDKSKLLTTDK